MTPTKKKKLYSPTTPLLLLPYQPSNNNNPIPPPRILRPHPTRPPRNLPPAQQPPLRRPRPPIIINMHMRDEQRPRRSPPATAATVGAVVPSRNMRRRATDAAGHARESRYVDGAPAGRKSFPLDLSFLLSLTKKGGGVHTDKSRWSIRKGKKESGYGA